VELTEVHTSGQDWWTLGFEATGPADLLRGELQATAAPRPTGLLSRSPQITLPGVMAGWCVQRPGAATWLVRIVRVGW
jgi:hypothetical protein